MIHDDWDDVINDSSTENQSAVQTSIVQSVLDNKDNDIWQNERVRMLAEITLENFRKKVSKCVIGFTAPIVGNYYASSAAQVEHDRLKIGDKLTLRFQPFNKFDVNAIGIYSDKLPVDQVLGHTDRYSAKALAVKLNDILLDFDVRFESKSQIELSAEVTSPAKRDGRVTVKVTGVTFKKKEN